MLYRTSNKLSLSTNLISLLKFFSFDFLSAHLWALFGYFINSNTPIIMNKYPLKLIGLLKITIEIPIIRKNNDNNHSYLPIHVKLIDDLTCSILTQINQ